MSTYTVEVCTVDEVRRHPDADRLDIIKIKGWECITGRDDHVPGDTVIFVPPDSLVTDSFVNEFNVTYLKGKGKNRIGAVKLRGEWSEGLVVPNKEGFKVGENVASFYEIIKYEPIQPPTPGKGGSRRGDKHTRAKYRLYGSLFPKYTHIENVKNFPDILEEGEEVVITEKIHGTNFRAGLVPLQGGKLYKLLMKLFGQSHRFLIGSRNVILDHDTKRTTFYGDNVYAKAAKMWTLDVVIPEDYIVYGEIYGRNTNGSAIQKNYEYGMVHLGTKFFGVSYKREHLSPIEARVLLGLWGLPRVPSLYFGPWYDGLIGEYTNLMSKLDEHTLQEGFVVEPVTPRKHKRVGRVIFKVLSPAYLAQKDRSEHH